MGRIDESDSSEGKFSKYERRRNLYHNIRPLPASKPGSADESDSTGDGSEAPADRLDTAPPLVLIERKEKYAAIPRQSNDRYHCVLIETVIRASTLSILLRCMKGFMSLHRIFQEYR